ncbi:methionine--tRNA ligase [filamentous cyanobacterium LEGE 11480]|uniref:Methionine--tRNA ligase n=1 Tax=Romeriopsis navalis LEGE 11480 TaxID=2777977 RepID=A0A928VRR9_9CYAN|nr:methionine--tRNA ligase [Romeriopsis navalis]MBE9030909.1 methionine--tRNA ligase [Romeriopsis navalis LEGE 11480]
MSALNHNQFAITTPLYYVNDVPHIGSAYPTVATDAISRWYRLKGSDVLFITGSDEHGQKIQRTAAERDRTPQAHCDAIVGNFKSLWEELQITHDRFIRTTSDRHAAVVQEFFQRVWDNGDIYLSQQQGYYCVACEEFKDEKELLPEQHCPIHTNRAVEWRDEENYFFRLSKYEDKLLQLYAEQPDLIQPNNRRNEVLSFVKQGLRDFSISRVNFDWGFPVPTDPSHVIYVWFDALLGYITASVPPDQAPTLANASHWWPAHTHIIGKDILRFHAVYWPAMLMSAGLPLPSRIFGHGFLVTKDGMKMGKSTQNIKPAYLLERYGVDAFRYYFLKEIKFGQDGNFEEVRFVNILNADLANDLGNLLNRTLKMVLKYFGNQVPELDVTAIAADHPLKSDGSALGKQVAQAYESLAFHDACEAIIRLMRAGNRYIDEQAPWKLYKQGEATKVAEVLYTIIESVRLAAYLLSPITPTISTRIYQQLGYLVDFGNSPINDVSITFQHHSQWGILAPGQALGEPQPVFQKLELPETSEADL